MSDNLKDKLLDGHVKLLLLGEDFSLVIQRASWDQMPDWGPLWYKQFSGCSVMKVIYPWSTNVDEHFIIACLRASAACCLNNSFKILPRKRFYFSLALSLLNQSEQTMHVVWNSTWFDSHFLNSSFESLSLLLSYEHYFSFNVLCTSA